MYLLYLVNFEYIPNHEDTGSSPGRVKSEIFLHLGLWRKTNMADATLEARDVKGTRNPTRNSCTSFERTRASRRELSLVSRFAQAVMVWFVCRFGVTYFLVTTRSRHPIKTSCQDAQKLFQDTSTSYQDTLSRHLRAD